MPKLDIEFKNRIKSLSKTDLEKLVIKMAGKDKTFHDYLVVNYLDTAFGEADFFAEAQDDLGFLFKANYRGRGEEKKVTAMIEACSKRINEFDKTCKRKNFKADLIVMVLDEVFSYDKQLFGTYFTKFDYKVGLLVRSLITIVATKIHADYTVDYRAKINEYLGRLHVTSHHIDFICALPQSI